MNVDTVSSPVGWTPPLLTGIHRPRQPERRAKADIKRLRTIGPYRLGRWLGGGSAADVFEATEASLGRVVVKLARPSARHVWVSLNTEIWCMRQQRQGRLVSPHVVQILDSGQVDQGRPYVVMEHRPGRSLQDHLLGHGRLREAAVIRLGRQLFRALGDLHRFGVVHRDLKPANLQVEPGGHLTLLDLGAAAKAGGESRGLVGTAVAMAPEQWGASVRVSKALDLYAAGCLLFRALTGRWPYPVQGNGSHHTLKTMRAHVTSPVRDPLEVAPGICSRELADLVMRLMAKAPGARPESARHAEVLMGHLPRPSHTDRDRVVEVVPSIWKLPTPVG